MPILEHLFLYNCHEFAQVFPFHFLAFTMEVEPNIFYSWVLDCINHFCKLFTNSFLRTFLVYQVDKVLLLVLCSRGIKMLKSSLVRLIKVWIHYNRWSPFHIWLHLPKHGDRPSYLEMSCNLESTIRFFVCNYLFCLTEICCISFLVKSTNNETTTRTSTVFS